MVSPELPPELPNAVDPNGLQRNSVLKEFGVTRGTEDANKQFKAAYDAARVGGDAAGKFAEKFIGDSYKGGAQAIADHVTITAQLAVNLVGDPFGTTVKTTKGLYTAVTTIRDWAPDVAKHCAKTMGGDDNVAKAKMGTTIILMIGNPSKGAGGKTGKASGATRGAGKVAKTADIPGDVGNAIRKGEHITLAKAKEIIRKERFIGVVKCGNKIHIERVPKALVTQAAGCILA